MPAFNANLADRGFYNLINVSAVTNNLGGTFIYRTVAPQGKAMPYVVYYCISDVDANDEPRRCIDLTYHVACVAADETRAGSVLYLIDNALAGGSVTVAGYNNYWLKRDIGLRMSRGEEVAGSAVFHAGAYYTVRLSSDS